jgi:hypothetical protein
VIRSDGNDLDVMRLPQPHTDLEVDAIWGATTDDVWLTSDRGVWRVRGDEPELLREVDNNVSLGGVGGSGSDDVWVIGYEVPGGSCDGDNCPPYPAVAMRFDGTDWSDVDVVLPGTPQSMISTESGDIWVAGYGFTAQYADGAWTSEMVDAVGGEARLWGKDSDDLWIADVGNDHVLHRTNGVWTSVPASQVWRIVGDGSGSVYGLGFGTSDELLQWNGDEFVPVVAIPPQEGRVYGLGMLGNTLFLLGEMGASRLFGADLQPWFHPAPDGPAEDLWILGDDELVALEGGTHVMRYATGQWTQLAWLDKSKWDVNPHEIVARSSTEAYIGVWRYSTDSPVVLRLDGDSLEHDPLPDEDVLELSDMTLDEQGRIWLVGWNAGVFEQPCPTCDHRLRVLRRDGGTWEDVGPDDAMIGHSRISVAGDRVFVLGNEGEMLMGEGDTWTRIDPGPTVINGYHARNETDIWLLVHVDGGEDGEVLRWDGTDWHDVPELRGVPLRSISGRGDTVWMATAKEPADVYVTSGGSPTLLEPAELAGPSADIYGTATTAFLDSRGSTWRYTCR